MEQIYASPTNSPVFAISNTTEYDPLLANFIQGVQFLEYQVDVVGSPPACRPSVLSAVTQNLLSIARSLTCCLEFLMSLQSPVHGPKLQRLQCLGNTWLRNATADLSIYCHRYSLAVLKISFELDKQVKRSYQDVERNYHEATNHL